MNEYQEALNCFTECWGCTKPEYYNDVMNKLRIEKERKELLQNLVDKATPKKPLKQEWGYNYQSYGGGYTSGECPDCGSSVGSGDNYCSRCSKKIDWSNEDD